MFKYIVFDFDGTLVDSKYILLSIFNQLAEKNNFEKMNEGDIQSLTRLSIKERCKLLKIPMYRIPFLAMESYSLYKSSMNNLALFDGIKGLLEELRSRGYGIAIISSNSESNIRDFLQKNKINYINEVLCSNNVMGKDKIIKRFLKTHKLSNADVIYVGDEARDIAACKKCDVKVIWVSWGYDSLEAVKKECPDYMVNTPGEILSIV